MARHLSDSWLDSCTQELNLPGSPWHEVKERISDYLVERIRIEGLTENELAKVRYLLGREFTSKRALVRNEPSPNTQRPNYNDEKLENLLKELTLNAAKDAGCFLKKDISKSPASFRSLVKLATEIFESSLNSQMQAARMSQFTQHSLNYSVTALSTLVDRDIEILGEAVVKILQKEPVRLVNISKRLRGRLLPVALRRLIYRLALVRKQKHSGFPGSDLGVGVLSYDDKITQQGLREAFAKGTRAGMHEMKSKDPTKSPLRHLIHLAVIEAYESLPGLKPHSKNMEIQKETSDVLNVVYTYSKKFKRNYVLWLFPLQVTISEDRYTKEHNYELAMWLNCIVKSCFPYKMQRINNAILSAWEQAINDTNTSNIFDHFTKLGIKCGRKDVEAILKVELPAVGATESNLHRLMSPVNSDDGLSEYSIPLYNRTSYWVISHPILCLRKWLTDLFVGVTDLPVTMFLWDQLFLFDWDSNVFTLACLALFYTLRGEMLKAHDVDSLCEVMIEKPFKVELYEIHKAWNDINQLNR